MVVALRNDKVKEEKASCLMEDQKKSPAKRPSKKGEEKRKINPLYGIRELGSNPGADQTKTDLTGLLTVRRKETTSRSGGLGSGGSTRIHRQSSEKRVRITGLVDSSVKEERAKLIVKLKEEVKRHKVSEEKVIFTEELHEGKERKVREVCQEENNQDENRVETILSSIFGEDDQERESIWIRIGIRRNSDMRTPSAEGVNRFSEEPLNEVSLMEKNTQRKAAQEDPFQQREEGSMTTSTLTTRQPSELQVFKSRRSNNSTDSNFNVASHSFGGKSPFKLARGSPSAWTHLRFV